MRRLTAAWFFTGIIPFILTSINIAAYAAPANPEPADFTQPDGTVVQVNVIGDEFLGWTEDADADLIIFDIELNGYCYAVWTDDGPVSTGELVGSPDGGISSAPGMGMSRSRTRGRDIPESLRERADREREEEMAILMSAGNMPFEMDMLSDDAPRRADVSTLKRNLLIIHATWSDRTGIKTPKLNGNQIYDRVFNPNNNSVNRYYKELIGAAEDVILPVAVNTPLNGMPGIIEVTLPGKHTDPGSNSTLRRELMTKVLTAASAQGRINFSVFDANKDGTLQTTELSIGVIIDGYESSSSSGAVPSFWGSAGSTYSPDRSSTNNVKIESAFGMGAFHGTTGDTVKDMLTIGIICHELGHSAYKFIDTYDTQTNVNDGETQGQGYWSLMAQGSWSKKSTSEASGSSPSYVDAYNLVTYGFVTPEVISGYAGNITLNSHLDIYRVNTDASSDQYFLLQQRKYGSADNYDRGAFYRVNTSSNSGSGGLLIYHIDKKVTSGNSKNSHYLAAIAEAHGGQQNLRTLRGTTGYNYGDLNDLWGGSKKLFSDSSDPSAKLYSAYTSNTVPPTRNTDSGIEAGNITWNGGAGNTTLYVAHGGIPYCCSVNTLYSLQSAIKEYAVAQDDMVITVTAGFPITSGLYIPENGKGKTLTIKSANATVPFTLTRGFSGYMFTVSDGAKLVFENIIVDGNKGVYQGDSSSIVYVAGGEFVMKTGAVLKNNSGYSGGGVYVYGGVFAMTGGEISGNTAVIGGGVNVEAACNWFGICVSGEFFMTGGKISGNAAYGDVFGTGGGVFVAKAGVFAMTGGEISGNTAVTGGGVFISESSEFTLGGTAAIRENVNGNVYLYTGAFIMLGSGAGGNGVAAPAKGMEVWVTKPGGGVIVESGAGPAVAAYFFADAGGGKVTIDDGGVLSIDVILYGDVNGDGVVDEMDVTALERHFARWPGAINESAADVNGDRVVDEMDVVVLERHFARWPGYETLPIKPPE